MSNPFLDDIATDPRRETGSVAGLNDHALEALLDVFRSMVASPVPRLHHQPVKAQLVLSVEPGYGKSHLIGRLFEELRGQATLVYLRPFMATDTCWRSLLHRTVQELNYPEERDSSAAGPEAHTQLDAFACGVLTHLVAGLIESGALMATDASASVDYLRKNPLDAFGLMQREHTWSDWLRVVIPQSYDAMAGELARTGMPVRECLPWLRVFFTLVMKRDNADLRNACMDWIAAVPIDDDARQNIDLSAGDVATIEDDNALCRRRLAALGCLAGYYRPFVLCFDQTDAYADNPPLAKQFSHVTEFLLAEMPHQMTVVTANRAPWDAGILPHFQNAQIERFRDTPISLEGINLRQARSLIQMRLEATEMTDHPNARRLDERWLEHAFQGRSEMAVRGLLRACSRRWEDEDSPVNGADQSLQERFQSLVEKHQDPTSGFSRFNAETLWWFVHEAAQGQCGLLVSRHDDHSYFNVRWQWDGKVRLFGFEGGANAKRWGAIADRAWELAQRNLGIHTILIRTPDLPAIPARTWSAVRQKILAARGKYLDVFVLDEQESARVHASRALVEESVAGDIPYTKKEALDFVRAKLRPLWEKLKMVGVIAAGRVAEEQGEPASSTHQSAVAMPANGSAAPVTLNWNGKAALIGRQIERSFASFNLQVRVIGCIEAPQLLRYRLETGAGVRAVSLAARARDLQAALALAEPPTIDAAPGYVTVDIPRSEPVAVPWLELNQRQELRHMPGPVAFPMGIGVQGEVIIADLANPNTCHMLVGGAAGSGKSEFLKSVIASLVARNQPSALQLSIVDPTRAAFGGIEPSPYLANPVLSSLDDALILLRKSVEEMEERCLMLAHDGLVNLKQRFDKGFTDIPFHLLVFDEFADLIVSGRAEKKEFESLVVRIAAKGRAAGIHLILATQRPDRSIVTGMISANLPLKVCLRVAKDVNSRIILGEPGAETLLGRGDLRCDLGKGVVRCQSPLIMPDEFLALMRRR